MPTPLTTRNRILREATAQFLRNGLRRTSLQSIANELGLTKATILYHFPTKDDLAAQLLEPIAIDLETMVARAEAQPMSHRAWVTVEGWLDTMLAHRQMLGLMMENLALLTRQALYQRMLEVWARALEAIAGPQPQQRDRVRAAQAISMVSDPVVYNSDVPTAVLREDILDGVRKLLAPPPDTTVPARRGRRTALSPQQVHALRELYQSRTRTADELATEFGVSRATVYRHVR